MLNGLVSALFVVAGGACAVAGYMVGSWHQRRAWTPTWSTSCSATAASTSSTSLRAAATSA